MPVAPILVTGFGPFLDVDDNPSAALARAGDGRHVREVPIVGRVLPVSYRRGPAAAIALAESLAPRFILGFGVARARSGVTVERFGRRALGGTPDVDGDAPPALDGGPEIVGATLDAARVAALLGGGLSDDAGGYVCNAWAFEVPRRCACPAVFVHIPPAGLAPEALLGALAVLLDDPQSPAAAASVSADTAIACEASSSPK